MEGVNGKGGSDPKPLQQTIAVLSFQAVYRSYQERRNKGSGIDPLKRKLRPERAATAGTDDEDAAAVAETVQGDHGYRAQP